MKTATKLSLINGFLLMGLFLLEYTGMFNFSLIFPYKWHKLLHILGAAVFMGNMIVGPVWFFFAYYSQSREILQFSDKLLRLTDMYITLPGLDLAVVNGLFLASVFGGMVSQPWLLYSLVGMVIMWVLTFPLLYIQEKIYRTIEQEPDNRVTLRKWIIRWSVWGTIVMIPPSVIFYLMVMKGW
ncbi:MAG: DUF2269 family protein [Bacteroidia bacterium]